MGIRDLKSDEHLQKTKWDGSFFIGSWFLLSDCFFSGRLVASYTRLIPGWSEKGGGNRFRVGNRWDILKNKNRLTKKSYWEKKNFIEASFCRQVDTMDQIRAVF